MLPLLILLAPPATLSASTPPTAFPKFHSWATSHSKSYLSSTESTCLLDSTCSTAYANYQTSSAYISSHPSTSSFELGHSQFSDLMEIPDSPFLPTPPIYNPDGDFPTESSSPFTKLLDALKSLHAPPLTPIDWSTTQNPQNTPLVPHVINQGLCGSCYAISSLSTTLTNFWITSSLPTSHQLKDDLLSTQQIIDCSSNNLHCVGGNPIFSYIYSQSHYITLDRFYPYSSTQNINEKVCKDTNIEGGIQVKDFEVVESTVEGIKKALQFGTVTVGEKLRRVSATSWECDIYGRNEST
ncbi:hypothetical protein TL16_g06330 [Triparma laevis f. inornata]|uniref:Peptidase C1A papain C-terminal domain-containing protein n=1 Tax=Triparma laevis f. inornata TaxID=1714386 RepID=A0A9W7EA64_9STRA|nr:hypothetical protein TL16_g06330 [Triparma laevis f. inornata]